MRLQSTRSDFKTTMNAAFFCAIYHLGTGKQSISWPTSQTRESNFWIKQVLTLTYFSSLSATRDVYHYRYHLAFLHQAFRTISNPQLPADFSMSCWLLSNIIIHQAILGYLTVEYCTLIDRNSGYQRSKICAVLSSEVVVQVHVAGTHHSPSVLSLTLSWEHAIGSGSLKNPVNCQSACRLIKTSRSGIPSICGLGISSWTSYYSGPCACLQSCNLQHNPHQQHR
jgi:hypothetical protein